MKRLNNNKLIKISITPGFRILILWFALANGWRSVMTVFGAAAVHEIGHWIALYSCGAKVTELNLGICGAVMTTENFKLSYGRELLCVLGGPAANLAAALLLRAVGSSRYDLIGVNLILCIYNLIPVRTLDGGRALELCMAWAFGPDAAESVTRNISAWASGLIACGIGFVIIKTGGSLWLFPAMLGMIYATIRESGLLEYLRIYFKISGA